MISMDAFVQEWNGKGIDVDGFPVGQVFQCYDPFIQYNREVIGCQPTIICAWSGYVKDFWEHFDQTILPQYYTQVGPLEKGQKGDVCIWGNAPATPLSHVALLLADNGDTQHIFGQNQPNPYCTIIDFTSNGLLGYLRPKGDTIMLETLPPVFNKDYYLATYPDVARAGVDVESHWLTDGIKEGRFSAPNFHVTEYLANYSDLQQAFGKNYKALIDHYINSGINEGRFGTTSAKQSYDNLVSKSGKLDNANKQIADLQAELLKKPEPIATPAPPVNEQVVVQNWFVKLWNSLFNK